MHKTVTFFEKKMSGRQNQRSEEGRLRDTPDMLNIELAPFQPVDLARLEAWLREEHVRRWFPHPGEILDCARATPVGTHQRLIVEDTRPVGYIRWAYVPREVLDSIGFTDIPPDSADIDLLIGERNNIGRGIGRAALELVVAAIRADGKTSLAALTTSVENRRAQRAFARCGFSIDREYVPEGFGPCYLMIRKIE